jgi:hypothetical protein
MPEGRRLFHDLGQNVGDNPGASVHFRLDRKFINGGASCVIGEKRRLGRHERNHNLTLSARLLNAGAWLAIHNETSYALRELCLIVFWQTRGQNCPEFGWRELT